jgi:hypothetical protein
MGMKTYYDNLRKEDNTAQRFPSYNERDAVRELMASMPDNLPVGKWELHTPVDMK